MTITVGTGSGADIVGQDARAVQAAVDRASAAGGGTVRILPGEYRLRNAILLRDGLCIEGAGPRTRLVKNPSASSDLAEDADWYQDELCVRDAAAFEVGDGITVLGEDPHHGGANVVTRTVVGKHGDRLRLDRQLRRNFWVTRGTPRAAALFPLITAAEGTRGLTVRNLVLDGNRGANDRLDGNYAGCIFLQDCREVRIEGVEARGYHGDGISWQICDDVIVERCHVVDNSDLGLHAGSGSKRSVVRGNRVEGNGIGIYLCWGVQDAVVEDNVVVRSRDHGVSIGHRDTANRFLRNRIVASGKVGIQFRDGLGGDRAPHGNHVEGNRIEDTGDGVAGVGIWVRSATRGTALVDNEIVDGRAGARGVGIRIGPEVGAVRTEGNRVSPGLVAVRDERAAAAGVPGAGAV